MYNYIYEKGRISYFFKNKNNNYNLIGSVLNV